MAKRGKGGRKRKPGERYPSGRLKTPHDYGNERVVALLSIFRPFQGGKADQWVKESAIGRAWAVGLLDGYDVDPAAIRDAGLDYAARYWGYYPTTASVANYEGEDRRGGDGSSETTPDPRGKRFIDLDSAILSAGRESYDAVQSLTVDHHWFPEENPAWLDRLINEKLLRLRRPVAGMLPMRGDADKLRLAIEGLLTIVVGTQGRRAAA